MDNLNHRNNNSKLSDGRMQKLDNNSYSDPVMEQHITRSSNNDDHRIYNMGSKETAYHNNEYELNMRRSAATQENNMQAQLKGGSKM